MESARLSAAVRGVPPSRSCRPEARIARTCRLLVSHVDNAGRPFVLDSQTSPRGLPPCLRCQPQASPRSVAARKSRGVVARAGPDADESGHVASSSNHRSSAGRGGAARREVGRGMRVVGTGSAVPQLALTNNDLAAVVDTNDEWIATRTGIRTRRILQEGESLTALAVEASRRALEMAAVEAADVDLILLCTSTPDDMFGGACMLQRDLGCSNAVAFDLTAACSGFVLGLVTASRFILGGGYSTVLLVGADALSRYVDWTDRGTCILFGDGAGAVVLRAAGEGERDGLLGFDIRSDGVGHKNLEARVAVGTSPFRASNGLSHAAPSQEESASGTPQRVFGTNGSGTHGHADTERQPAAVPAATPPSNVAVWDLSTGGAVATVAAPASAPSSSAAAASAAPADSMCCKSAVVDVLQVLPGRAAPCFISMNGREVYKFAVKAVPQVLESALAEAGMSASEVDWLLLHQANQRIMDAVANNMGLGQERVISNVAQYGNTSAASIPLALDEAVRSGRVQQGHVLALAGFGAGLTWAGAILRFG